MIRAVPTPNRSGDAVFLWVRDRSSSKPQFAYLSARSCSSTSGLTSPWMRPPRST